MVVGGLSVRVSNDRRVYIRCCLLSHVTTERRIIERDDVTMWRNLLVALLAACLADDPDYQLEDAAPTSKPNAATALNARGGLSAAAAAAASIITALCHL